MVLEGLHCEVAYYPSFLSREEADELYQYLVGTYSLEPVPFQLASGGVFTADYGKLSFLDHDLFESKAYTAEEWGRITCFPEPLSDVKNRVEELTGKQFQVGVCIYYPDGKSGVDYHSDYIAFGDTSVIPSLSLGEERDFCLREIASGEVVKKQLEHGSLFIMGKGCQERYEHSLPLDERYTNPRINITFRQFGG